MELSEQLISKIVYQLELSRQLILETVFVSPKSRRLTAPRSDEITKYLIRGNRGKQESGEKASMPSNFLEIFHHNACEY